MRITSITSLAAGLSLICLSCTSTQANKQSSLSEQALETSKDFPSVDLDTSLEQEVKLVGAEGNKLAGTLTLPAESSGPFNLIILHPGSGPVNRNSRIQKHQPFVPLADHLSKQGLAVFRYDKRGVGLSEGDLAQTTTKDLAKDLAAVYTQLAGHSLFKGQKIGYLGHSEGASAATLAIKETPAAFFIGLAGPALRGADILALQSKYLIPEGPRKASALAANRKLYAMLASDESAESVKKHIGTTLSTERYQLTPEQIDSTYNNLTSPWFSTFLKRDPLSTYCSLSIPSLLLYGAKDLQVPQEENTTALKTCDWSSVDVSVNTVENANHLFQSAETGHPREYNKLQESMSQPVLAQITAWLEDQDLVD